MRRLAKRLPSANYEAVRAGRPLTPRQVEILALVAQGLTYRGIARRLCVANATVYNQVSGGGIYGGILTRMGARSIAHAVALAYDAGVLPVDIEAA